MCLKRVGGRLFSEVTRRWQDQTLQSSQQNENDFGMRRSEKKESSEGSLDKREKLQVGEGARGKKRNEVGGGGGGEAGDGGERE